MSSENQDILSAPARRKLKKAISEVERHKRVIAARRDKLRELNDEIAAITESLDEGLDDLGRATDAFSRFL